MSEISHLVSLAVPKPVFGRFTYAIKSEDLDRAKLGACVQIQFGKTKTHGFIVEPPQALGEWREKNTLDLGKIKFVEEWMGGGFICPPEILKLCFFAEKYYQTPLGEILYSAVPSAVLKKTKARKSIAVVEEHVSYAPLKLNPDQHAAIDAIISPDMRVSPAKQTMLLQGVTGSGKTEVYIECARRFLAFGKGVLVLVPEIALTPQLFSRFQAAFGEKISLWHSAMPEGQRHDEYFEILSGKIRIVIGARSAVFAPIQNLGLIVVDEEHDPSYKQEERARYHARDLAVVRGAQSGAQVILGSATPSLETLERVRDGKYGMVTLPNPAIQTVPTQVEIVDLSSLPRVEGIQAPLADRTVEVIRETLGRGEQVMVYLNRRGFSAFLICEDCGESVQCSQCSISLSYYKRRAQVRCALCGHKEKAPDRCVKCDGSRLLPVGAGTESLEEQLPKLIPEMKAIRLDRDQMTSNQRLEDALAKFRALEFNTLLGTQMLVKGHDFPRVTLVVVVLADSLFRFPDFRAVERAYQVLTQVAGRAGRHEIPGRVLIQTFDPDHPVLKVLTGEKTAKDLLEGERDARKLLGYPPMGRVCRLRVEDRDQEVSFSKSAHLALALKDALKTREDRTKEVGHTEILGPSEAFMEKVAGVYRWDIWIKSKSVEELSPLMEAAQEWMRAQKWSCLVDVDPYGLN